MSKLSVFNELDGVEYGVWCEVSVGIDPTQWASLCRWLGHLEPDQFNDLLKQLRRRRLIAGAKRLATAVLGTTGPTQQQTPVISVGPSGLGGQYQKELKARSCRPQRKRQHFDRGRGVAVDIRA